MMKAYLLGFMKQGRRGEGKCHHSLSVHGDSNMLSVWAESDNRAGRRGVLHVCFLLRRLQVQYLPHLLLKGRETACREVS